MDKLAREWTEDMGEISGFGGGYESACRAMVFAGLDWFDEHPDADPRFHGYHDIYGVISEDNDDAKQLTEAVLAAADGCSGAMHQAAITHVFAARRLGWEEYCRQMRERSDD